MIECGHRFLFIHAGCGEHRLERRAARHQLLTAFQIYVDMRKNLLLTLLLACLIHPAFAQMYTQYFDGADTSFANSQVVVLDPDSNNVWQIGMPHKLLFDSAATLPNAMVTDTIAYIPRGNTSRFYTQVTGITTWGIYALQWKQKLDLNQGHHGGIIEYSIDNGLSWSNVFNNGYVYNFYGYQQSNADTLPNGEYAFSGTDTTWRDIWLCFDMSWVSQLPDTLVFRYTLQTDSVEVLHEGWMLDNMVSHITYQHTLTDSLTEDYLTVYPNPTQDFLYVQVEKLQQFHIIEEMQLFNASGQVVDAWYNIPTKFFIDIRKYATGSYTLKVKTNLKTELKKVMIAHD